MRLTLVLIGIRRSLITLIVIVVMEVHQLKIDAQNAMKLHVLERVSRNFSQLAKLVIGKNYSL